MLEPLHACNLTCTGLRAHTRVRILPSPSGCRSMSCLALWMSAARRWFPSAAAKPMMYPQIAELTAGILQRNRHILPLHHGIASSRSGSAKFTPDKRCYFNVHDWMACGRTTTSRWSAKAFSIGGRGHPNRQEGWLPGLHQHHGLQRDRQREIEELFEYLRQFHVDGHQIAPAYGTRRSTTARFS